MQISELVGRLCEAASRDDPEQATASVLRDYARNLRDIVEALEFLPGLGTDPEQSFYRSREVSALKVKFLPAQCTPPHDHGTWAVILLLSGKERNTLHTRDGDGIREVSSVVLAPGDVLPMRPEVIHVAECVSSAPAVGLHVYGGDLPILSRSVWHPHTLVEHAHSEPMYAEMKAIARGTQNSYNS